MSKNQAVAQGSAIVIAALAHIQSVSGEIVKTGDEATGIVTDGKLVLTCSGEKPGETQQVEVSLSQFDAIYRGMVKCWPVIKPLKDEIAIARRSEIKVAAEATKAAATATKQAEKDAAKVKLAEDKAAKAAAKQAEKDAAKAAREAAAVAAKAKKDAEIAAAKAAKVVADTAKATAAANVPATAAKVAAAIKTPATPAATPAKPAAKPMAAKK